MLYWIVIVIGGKQWVVHMGESLLHTIWSTKGTCNLSELVGVDMWSDIKVKVLIWYSPMLYLVSICDALQPPVGNSPNLGVSHHLEVFQISMQLTSQVGLVQMLSNPMFAGTHFTYPQKDRGLSQPCPGWVGSGYWTWKLSLDSPLFYQLSYSGHHHYQTYQT